ncbi:hypothetical protein BM221_003042 [Beauveria bassiana]|uniref:Uncharacterized protein n=1 Tax=Beauveria bassiana TaxID=176275 RepID=A0A2N6NTJ5_BEABA|nr:hypothetical protein BM221_003042 [Beauveria bassiana]
MATLRVAAAAAAAAVSSKKRTCPAYGGPPPAANAGLCRPCHATGSASSMVQSGTHDGKPGVLLGPQVHVAALQEKGHGLGVGACLCGGLVPAVVVDADPLPDGIVGRSEAHEAVDAVLRERHADPGQVVSINDVVLDDELVQGRAAAALVDGLALVKDALEAFHGFKHGGAESQLGARQRPNDAMQPVVVLQRVEEHAGAEAVEAEERVAAGNHRGGRETRLLDRPQPREPRAAQHGKARRDGVAGGEAARHRRQVVAVPRLHRVVEYGGGRILDDGVVDALQSGGRQGHDGAEDALAAEVADPDDGAAGVCVDGLHEGHLLRLFLVIVLVDADLVDEEGELVLGPLAGLLGVVGGGEAQQGELQRTVYKQVGAPAAAAIVAGLDNDAPAVAKQGREKSHGRSTAPKREAEEERGGMLSLLSKENFRHWAFGSWGRLDGDSPDRFSRIQ